MGIVDTAESYVGKVRYEFGADNIKGGVGDCSSFTQQVFRDNGINIGRDTRTQYAGGQHVTRDELQAGDLVFFQNTYRKGVSHVGIYIGNGKFIHNDSTRGVTEADLDSPYYRQHWLGGKRVSGAANTGEAARSPDTNTGHVNPTYTAEEITAGAPSAWNTIFKVVAMLAVAVLAVVFFLQIFNESVTNIVVDTATKGRKETA